MKGRTLLGKLSLIALFAVAAQSCKKENGIDNNNVIQRPYVLYSADARGTIYKTNDGDNYKTIFPGDGATLRALITSKANLLVVKDETLFLSQNEGKSFNPIKNTVATIAKNIKWPFFILDVPSMNRVFLGNAVAGPGKVSFSPENGTYFLADTNRAVDTPNSVESFVQLDNGLLFSYSISGSVYGVSKLFIKTGKDEPWKPQPTDLTSPYNFYLSHEGNRLVATDYDGLQGSWYSDDSGKTFKQYSGLPTGKILYTTYYAYQTLLVGTKDQGVYRYDGTKFTPSNTGLDGATTVYSIVGKDNYYKNTAVKKLFYIATNTGIYRSEDLAKSWVKVKSGDHRLVY